MTLEERLIAAMQAVADEFKLVYSKLGDTGTLTTTDKASLVAAINELESFAVTGHFNVDPNGEIAALKTALINGAGTDYDTLHEIYNSNLLDANGLVALLTSVNNLVRYDAVQALTDTQKTTARTNIGVVPRSLIDFDYAARFNQLTVHLFP